MTQIEQPFEELIIPRRDMFDFAETRYRVYFDAKNFKLVEAVSAIDALRNSGINKAYKIERHNPMGDNVIQFSQQPVVNKAVLQNNDTHEYVEIEPEKAAQRPHEEPVLSEPEPIIEPTSEKEQEVAPSAPAENSGLSNEEVEKLLKGQ